MHTLDRPRRPRARRLAAPAAGVDAAAVHGPVTRARSAAPVAALALLVASRAAAQTPVAGTAWDSVAAAPLAGALVQLVAESNRATSFSAVADSAGRYRIDAVPPGRYVAGVIHPTFDLLGLDAQMGVVTVRADTVQRLDVAIANGPRLRAAVCGAAPDAEVVGGVLVGQVRDAESGAPLGDAAVALSWREIAIGGGQGARVEQRRVPVRLRDGGYFAVCGVPTDDRIFADAEAPGRRPVRLAVEVAPAGVTRRDLALGTSSGAPEATLSGVVRRPDGQPAGSAAVVVLGAEARATTGEDGRFTLSGLPAGTHDVEARAIGFQPARVVVELSAARPATAEVRLGARVQTLETVQVLGRGSRGVRHQRDFLDRMKSSAAGRFVTPQEIERIRPMQASDALTRMPGVEVLARGTPGTSRSGGGYQVMMRDPTTRGLCSPTVYVDGFPVQDGGYDFDALISPATLLGIEVYRTPGTAPAQYTPTTGSSCGVILVWTKV